ncbi:MAG: type IV secretion system DNA-binding domain-containing protein [Candidatus Magasanikbacteria bacterium]|nr:type IV secretion system DNA-binding domain-containing protein [Candidatus Magasanikbacteria bacterium]
MADMMTNSADEKKPPIEVDPNVNYFGLTNYRNQFRKFGVKLDDRRRHMYVVGKTGMGKTTMLENMVLNDIYAGHGVGLVDPHGDFAEKIINFIPANRINDVVYFNPADINYPVGFNMFEMVNPEHKHLVASGLMGVFKKIWVDMWSSRMEYILNNTILALLDFPDTTLLGINRLLADKEYRERVVRNLKDPVVKAFWETEFAAYNDRYKQEAVAPIQNKIGQFLSASVIRNIVAQVKSKINIREIMDTKKIFIMNLSKGRIGEDNSRLLGGMLITKIQLSAMERVDIPEKERKDFFLYVDEFQNFATESFANILSEARKYRLGLIMAHQYMEQLDETVLAAVIGNVGSLVTYRVGSTDAEVLVKEFSPIFTEEDLVNLPKFNIYLKLMIDGVSSRPFSALSMPPIGSPTDSAERVIRVSRERYGIARDKIEEKIMRWSGMEVGGLEDEDDLEPKTEAGAPSPVLVNGEPPKKLGDFVKKEEQKTVEKHEPAKPKRDDYKPQGKPASNKDRNKKSFHDAPRKAPRPVNQIIDEDNAEPVKAVPVIPLSTVRPSEIPKNQPSQAHQPAAQSKFVRPGQVVKLDDGEPIDFSV